MVMDLVQKKISPGQKVKFVLKTGTEVHGIVHEITDQYISVHNENEVIVILEEYIAGWKMKTGDTSVEEFSGLSEDTVVEKVEFDWEEDKTKDQTESTMTFSSPKVRSLKQEDLKSKWLYMGIGSAVTIIILFIENLIIG